MARQMVGRGIDETDGTDEGVGGRGAKRESQDEEKGVTGNEKEWGKIEA